jgi:P27 family predicted phage terminase small subunit
MRVLTLADRDILAMYCQTFSRMLDAQAALSKSGLLMKCKTGYVQQSPLLAIVTECTRSLTILGREMGLSPSSRTRIRTEPDSKPASTGLIR